MYFELERVKRILTELKGLIYPEKVQIRQYQSLENDCTDLAVVQDSSGWEEFNYGDRWGGVDRHYWFTTSIELPESFKGRSVVYRISTGREGEWDADNPQMLFHLNGKPVQGIDVNHTEVLLTECGVPGQRYDIALFAHSGMKQGDVFLKSELAVLDKETEELYYNLKVPMEIAEQLADDDKRRMEIIKYITNAVNLLDLRKHHSKMYQESVKDANAYLQTAFYNDYCGNEDVIETCVGHTHIDIAWLWTISQTRKKAIRSFSTVLRLMKQYQEYIFMSSQPQLYQFVKEDYPEVYAEIQEMVRAGRWEVEGAMWLEADCNLASGEALVRQVLFGKQFIREEFDKDSKVLWLPDVFGYSAALPQIMKKSGVNYFMTTKIGWNEYNRMPMDTFLWRGIDGTEMLTHFITTADYKKDGKLENNTTYNGYINGSRVMGCWQRYQNKELTNEVLNCYGHGDGGGGPTKEMLESAKRFEHGIPGSPIVKQGTVLEYFERLEETVRDHKKLPRWVGELYLEYHRGTYTSMGRNKKSNRRAEFLNQEVELFSVMNTALKGKEYPSKVLRQCWEKTLLNQFHDIIPGSSIEAVYEDSKRDYELIEELGNSALDTALSDLSSSIRLDQRSVVAFNQLGFERDDLVLFDLPEGWRNVQVFDGELELPVQLIEGNQALFFGRKIPSKGWKSFGITQATEATKAQTVAANPSELGLTAGGTLESSYYTVGFDACGNISSIYDKHNMRQVLKNNQSANRLQAFEDKPHEFDAWNLNIYYQEKMWELDACDSIRLTERGPVRTAVEITRSFLDSKIIQTVYFYENSPRIDFKTWIDWKERQVLLKAAFPVEINASKATYDIQFGNVERPTHWNTSWDYARFEVCAHKWADVSEGDYGVALLNDCKYGYDIKDSQMRLTLLKSATYPNPVADQEEHEFTYSLLPHIGDFKQGGVVNQAYGLNCPILARVEHAHDGALAPTFGFAAVDRENVVIGAVKKAEASDEMIIRMYECYNSSKKVTCTLANSIASVEECDLLENSLESGTTIENQHSFSFEMKPFEIKTFKISFEAK